MKVNLGRCVQDERLKKIQIDMHNKSGETSPIFPYVCWDEDLLVNGHMTIIGGSGTGKTHTLRKILDQMQASSPFELKAHIFDVHGDIDIQGAAIEHFDEQSEVGLNPLQINPDPRYGGVRKAIQRFISTINQSSQRLGDRQESVLRSLLESLYNANGIYADNPKSWIKPRKQPNINDLLTWSQFKYRSMFLGGDSKAVKAFESLSKEVQKKHAAIKRGLDGEKHSEMLLKLTQSCIDSYTVALSNIDTGREFEELIKYDSKSTLKSVVDRISNLHGSGVFKSTPPHFGGSKLCRYHIRSLSLEEKRMFVFFRLLELYEMALQRGEIDYITDVVVIDELKIFITKDEENIINRLINEVRKFGMIVILSAQNFEHLTDDMLSSIGTKIILGIDEQFWLKSSRRLQINKEWLSMISPRKLALINMKRVLPPTDPMSGLSWFFSEVHDRYCDPELINIRGCK
jgi:hypothetical protein